MRKKIKRCYPVLIIGLLFMGFFEVNTFAVEDVGGGSKSPAHDIGSGSKSPAQDIGGRRPPAQDIPCSRPPDQDAHCNWPPAQDGHSNKPPAEDVYSGKAPAQDVRSNKPPAQDVRSNKAPAQDVRSNKPPAEDVYSGKPPAQDVRSNKPPAQDVRSNKPPAQDVRSNKAPAHDIGSGSKSPAQDKEPCVRASEESRQQLYELGIQLQNLLHHNLDAFSQMSSQMIKRVIDDFARLGAFAQTAFEYGRQNSKDPVGAVERDLNKGILDPNNDLGFFLEDPTRLVTHSARASKYDPLKVVRTQLDRYKQGLKNNPGRAAGDILYDGSNLVPLRRLPKVISSCPTLKGTTSTIVRTTKEVEAVDRATQISQNLTLFIRRAERFFKGWGDVPKTGGWGNIGKAVKGTAYNPECGKFNCFAVALAKARSRATGRPFQAPAIRPTMTKDVKISNIEVEDVLRPIAQGRPMRNPKLYTKQEILDYVVGRPSPMTRERIKEIIRFSPDDVQGLVFVRYPDKENPGELLGHVFNVHKENGVAKFVDETVSNGQDASFYFDIAKEVFFYEYNYPR